jgi:hypothetical protein
VSVGVVDVLEPVEVGEQHPDQTGMAGEPVQGVGELLEEHPADRQAGERVVHGAVRQLGLGLAGCIAVRGDDQVGRRDLRERAGGMQLAGCQPARLAR